MKNLLYYNPILALKEVKHTPKGQFLQAIQSLFYPGTCVTDRSGLGMIPLKVSIIEPLPTTSTQLHFKEVCVQTVLDILKLAEETNRKPCILYSGGVDSVLIMAAFEHVCSEEQRKRIIVAMNPWSIKENYSFYNRIIRGRYGFVNSTKINKLFNEKYVLVTGNQPGMLFGNDPLIDTIKQTFKLTDHATTGEVEDVFSKNELFRENKLDIKFKQLKDLSPVPITNLRDYCWWIAFCIRWQGTSQLIWKSQTTYESIKRIDYQQESINYFATPLMQQWALANREFCNLLSFQGGYKTFQKQIIHDWTDDSEIFAKRKIGSTSFGMARVVPATKFITHDTETDRIEFSNEGTLERFFV